MTTALAAASHHKICIIDFYRRTIDLLVFSRARLDQPSGKSRLRCGNAAPPVAQRALTSPGA
jgi:hypothetical protein